MSLSAVSIFLAGVATFFSPCVLPLVPVYVAALAAGGGNGRSGSRRALLRQTAFFTLGFVVVFALLGLGASSAGAFLSEHRTWLLLAGAGITLLLGLKLLGWLPLPLLDRVFRLDESRFRTRFGSLNALMMGVLFAGGWSPCAGPVLASVLTYTATQAENPLTGAAWLTVYGLGFALPLWVFALLGDAGTGALRRARRWIPTLEKVSGAALLAVALWLFAQAWPVVRPNEESSPMAASRSPSETLADLEAGEQSSSPGQGLPVVVEIYSPDCPVCRRMEPLVRDVTEACDQHGVTVQAVDVTQDANREWIRRYGIVGVPTFLFLDPSGAEVNRLVGAQSRDTLHEALAALRGAPCPGLEPLAPERDLRTLPPEPAPPSNERPASPSSGSSCQTPEPPASSEGPIDGEGPVCATSFAPPPPVLPTEAGSGLT